MTELNEKEATFVNAYLTNGNNCTEAYLQVSPNVKRETARIEGSRLKRSPKVTRYLAEHNTALVQSGEEQSKINKKYLIDTAHWGIEKSKKMGELGTLFKGIEVGAKLTGAYTQDEDDETKYTKFIQKISVKQMNVNIGKNTKDYGTNTNVGHNSPSYDDAIEGECVTDPGAA